MARRAYTLEPSIKLRGAKQSVHPTQCIPSDTVARTKGDQAKLKEFQEQTKKAEAEAQKQNELVKQREAEAKKADDAAKLAEAKKQTETAKAAEKVAREKAAAAKEQVASTAPTPKAAASSVNAEELLQRGIAAQSAGKNAETARLFN